MQTYSLEISEEQRVLIVDALRVLSPDGEEACEERDLLIGMLDEMPAEEAKSPGQIHALWA